MDVLFGDKDHFRRESVWFEVVDLESPYHALLGRPALAKFMAVPHYAYLKMKMPSSKGILTVSGDYRKSSACAAESSRLAESLVIAAEKRLLDRVGDGWQAARVIARPQGVGRRRIIQASQRNKEDTVGPGAPEEVRCHGHRP